MLPSSHVSYLLEDVFLLCYRNFNYSIVLFLIHSPQQYKDKLLLDFSITDFFFSTLQKVSTVVAPILTPNTHTKILRC